MAQLLLVNPSPRKKKMATRKKPRTAKQKAATRKLVALNRRKARGAAPKRKTPAKRKRVATKAPSRATGLAPTKRLVRRRKLNKKRGYFPNPIRRTRASMMTNVIDKQIKPAATMAGGALLLDIGYGYLGSYIPVVLNNGMARHATKGVVAVAMSYLVGNFVKQSTANEMAKGALTVTMHDAMKEAMATFMPSIPLGYYNASPIYGDAGVGYFSEDSGEGLGYFSQDGGTGFHPMQSGYDSSVIDG